MNQPLSYQESLDRLVDLLDSVVEDQVGTALAQTMQRIRRLAVERRAGLPDAQSRLSAELQRLELPQLRSVIRWLSLFFDLANLVEDLQRVHVLEQRDESAQRTGNPRAESIGAAVFALKERGFSATDVQFWLQRLRVEPVFTAHPSEAKRRTTRQLLRRIRDQLPALEGSDGQREETALLADLTVLWQSDLVRPQRPPVMSEVSRGVFFAVTLWDVVPEIYRELRSVLLEAYPHHRFQIPAIVRFGTWIGGDRDGHPFVTVDVTRQTLARLRRAGLENHLSQCRKLLGRLVMSDQQISSDPRLSERTTSAADSWPQLDRRLDALSAFESYRRFLRMMEYRLECMLSGNACDDAEGVSYASAEEFRGDLVLLNESLMSNRGQRIAAEIVQPWLDQFDTFGFHFAALDIRQNSDMHRRCVAEMLDLLKFDVGESIDHRVLRALTSSDGPGRVEMDQLSSESRETFETFVLLADEIDRWGLRPLGGYVISMTHSPTDVLAVLWMWTTAWGMSHADAPLPSLPIIPLFETIDDLQRADGIMDELFGIPEYLGYVTGEAAPVQTVMVGYSDSTKDGGYLSSCWELHQSQRKLADVAALHHVELTVFHGRGGALGRGGGPAARAIQSLPPAAVGGRLRVTEQGEVLAERYDDPRIAHRHLEQIINATLLVSTQDEDDLNPQWSQAMARMSAESFAKYRSLVGHPGFLSYFGEATPISEIETLPIGSRPARRGMRQSLSDLRAIPWTFAWTQSRHLLPAWYGFGTAVRSFIDESDQEWLLLQTMYDEWPMFQALVDNAELALAKTDMDIAHQYAELVDQPASEEIWREISAEFDRSRGAVLIITNRHELLSGTNWLRNSIQRRNPYVDPLNLAQIDLLTRKRSHPDNNDLQDLLRLSIQGIASGLRTTG